MTASVSNELNVTRDDPRQVLSGWLDDYAADRCDLDDLNTTFVSVVKTDAEAPWVALALLDQYQRRGRVSSSLAASLKTKINQVVFGKSAALTGSATDSSATPLQESVKPEVVQRREIPAEPSIVTTPSPVASEHRSDPHFRFNIPDQTAVADLRSETVLSSHPQPAPAPSKRILRQRYELLELIGTSASGTVYRALDRERVNLPHASHHIAVSVISSEQAKQPSVQEIWSGLYRAQSFSHPNIRSIFEIGRDGDTCFAVMELLDGELLSTLLRQTNGQPMSWRHARGILQGVGAALLYMQDRGFVHGKLRPESIMVTQEGEIKLVEFGPVSPDRNEPWISEEAQSYGLQETSLHIEQVYTPLPRVSDDVFSLACIAYELLSGRPPYDKQSVALASAGHLAQRPSRSAWFNQHQWRVLRRALLLKPADRTITIRELLVGLGCEPASAPVVPPKTLLADRTDWQLLQSRPLLSGAVFFLAAALLTYILITVLPVKFSHNAGGMNAAEPQTQSLTTASTASQDSIKTPVETLGETSTVTMPATVETDPAAKNDIRSVASAPYASTLAITGKSEPSQSPRTTNEAQDTTAASTVKFTQNSFVAFEDNGSARVMLHRAGRLNTTLHVRWSLVSGSAKPGEDYADLPPGIVDIPAGVRDYTLVIPLASDAAAENTELFLVKVEAIDDTSQSLTTITTDVIVVDDD